VPKPSSSKSSTSVSLMARLATLRGSATVCVERQTRNAVCARGRQAAHPFFPFATTPWPHPILLCHTPFCFATPHFAHLSPASFPQSRRAGRARAQAARTRERRGARERSRGGSPGAPNRAPDEESPRISVLQILRSGVDTGRCGRGGVRVGRRVGSGRIDGCGDRGGGCRAPQRARCARGG